MRVSDTGVPAGCPAPRLFTLSQAAAYLAVSAKVIRNQIDSGALPRIALCRRVLIDKSDLDRLVLDLRTREDGT